MQRKKPTAKPPPDSGALKTFSALLESVREEEVTLIIVPANQRARFRAAPVVQALLAPCLFEPMGEVFTVTVHGEELINVVPATPRP